MVKKLEEKKIQSTIRLSESIYQKLIDFCHKKHFDCPPSSVIEEALKKFFEAKNEK